MTAWPAEYYIPPAKFHYEDGSFFRTLEKCPLLREETVLRKNLQEKEKT